MRDKEAIIAGRVARQIERITARIEEDAQRKLERIEKLLEDADKVSVLGKMDADKKAELTTKLSSVATFLNANKKPGKPDKANPLV